jgi:mono/diheme cytochrome c family protein
MRTGDAGVSGNLGRGAAGRRIPTRAVATATALFGASLLLACLGCREAPSEAPPGSAAQGGPGRILYLTYCEGCHGPGGRGDGRAAPALRTPPPDLTRLSERYGTPLDRAALAQYIDGRILLGLHGEREMPVWGREFFADAPPSTPGLEHTREHLIQVLIDYLQSIQSERAL